MFLPLDLEGWYYPATENVQVYPIILKHLRALLRFVVIDPPCTIIGGVVIVWKIRFANSPFDCQGIRG